MMEAMALMEMASGHSPSGRCRDKDFVPELEFRDGGGALGSFSSSGTVFLVERDFIGEEAAQGALGLHTTGRRGPRPAARPMVWWPSGPLRLFCVRSLGENRSSAKRFPHCSTAISSSAEQSPSYRNTPPEIIQPKGAERILRPKAPPKKKQKFKAKERLRLLPPRRSEPVRRQGASSSPATTSSELENLRSSYQELETKLKEAEQKKEQAEKQLAEKNSELIRRRANSC
ncbi:hypothetical protein QYE76_064485 [Lolium multiflorum]|uniref:Uncharacterized protein n=1 Tax=Lolium multiflorum TaxID=4521 RepID=A0AAD8S912_LOLMU|nr:hypothetical protein QYE76_064485 [Lolium multiflorum]